MRLPADQARERRGDRLVGDEIARQRHARSRDHDDQQACRQPRPGLRQEAIGRNLRHIGDDPPHEPGNGRVGQRHKEFDDEQRDEQRLGLPCKMPQEPNAARPAAPGVLGVAVGFRNCSKRENIHCEYRNFVLSFYSCLLGPTAAGTNGADVAKGGPNDGVLEPRRRAIACCSRRHRRLRRPIIRTGRSASWSAFRPAARPTSPRACWQSGSPRAGARSSWSRTRPAAAATSRSSAWSSPRLTVTRC